MGGRSQLKDSYTAAEESLVAAGGSLAAFVKQTCTDKAHHCSFWEWYLHCFLEIPTLMDSPICSAHVRSNLKSVGCITGQCSLGLPKRTCCWLRCSTVPNTSRARLCASNSACACVPAPCRAAAAAAGGVAVRGCSGSCCCDCCDWDWDGEYWIAGRAAPPHAPLHFS